jgi:hypothetical protein
MAFIHKKAMGPHQSPMAFFPILGMALRVTLLKIKVRVIKIKALVHDFSSRRNIKPIGSGMSRRILRFFWKSPEIPDYTERLRTLSLSKCRVNPAYQQAG